MPLSDTGDRMTDSDFNQRARATDQVGNRVVVIGSAEVAEDFGWGAVFDTASRKYDEGNFETVDGLRKIHVLLSDINA